MPLALVTGTTTGIGLATALHLARKGFEVRAALRNPERGVLLRKAVEQEELPVEIVVMDVTESRSVTDCIEGVLAKDGDIDVLVNNAGLSGAAPLEDVPEAEHRAMFEANYFGCIRTIQAVLPHMRERGDGTIVNVSSVTGRVAVPNQVPYTASKHAVEAASEALAAEVVSLGIRVAIIEPGVFATSIWENSEESTRYDRNSPYKQIMRRNGKMYSSLLREAGDPFDVARVIHDAITTDDPKLRYLVGADAEAMAAGRERSSDEEFLTLGADLTDEECDAAYQRILGLKIF
jgi:NAD(P)-dependent dehydrogenase (short-subunit alcohol dehydrogenase family)